MIDSAASFAEWIADNWEKALTTAGVSVLVAAIMWVMGLPARAVRLLASKVSARRRRLEEALKALGGSVEVVDRARLSRPASAVRVQQYYEGGTPAWDIIAAGADSDRDQHDTLLQLLRAPEPSLRLVCVIGGPGAGKTTLALRAAADLARQDRALVLRVKRPDDPAVWFRLADVCAQARQPVYVLADDLFHHEGAVEALRGLDPSLALTILATARAAEYRPYRLPCQPIAVPLEPPSAAEKQRLLAKLGKSELTPEQQSRLDRAHDFQVLMFELTTGRQHVEAIAETVRRLKEEDPVGHAAYKYVCFCSQFDVSMPSGILERLNPEGQFYRIGQRPKVQGLILPDEAHSGHLRAGHARRAAIAFEVYHQAPHAVLAEVVKAADRAQADQRRFAARLVQRITALEKDTVTAALPGIAPVLSVLRSHGTGIAEMVTWRNCFQQLGMAADEQACQDAIGRSAAASAWECAVQARVLRQLGRESEALAPMLRWIRQDPEARELRRLLLGVVERQGSPEQIHEQIQQTRRWLAAHPEDGHVRSSYLGLVERHAPELVREVVEDTLRWAAGHPDSGQVRTALLGVVERQFPEWLPEVLKDTRRWLAAHPRNSIVREAFLRAVQRQAPDLIPDVLAETRRWLVEHPEDSNVRTIFLRLVARHAPDLIPEVVSEARGWLAAHPDDRHVRTAFLGLAVRPEAEPEFGRVVADLRSRMANWQDQEALPELVSVAAGRKGLDVFEAELRQALDRHGIAAFIEALRRDPGQLVLLANWLRDHDLVAEARQVYDCALGLPPAQTSKYVRLRAVFGYARLQLRQGHLGRARRLFGQVLGSHKGHVAARVGMAEALQELGRRARRRGRLQLADHCFAGAEQEFRHAAYWRRINRQGAAHILTRLGWLYCEWERYEPAVKMFRDAVSQPGGEYFASYWGAGKALMALGRIPEAEAALRRALELAPEGLGPPAAAEIPALLQECRTQLGRGQGPGA